MTGQQHMMGSAIMKEKYNLSKDQKEAYCSLMTGLLSMLRIRLGMTQEELSKVSGVSRVTISQIESGRAKMNWLHFTALMMVCNADRNAKEFLYANGLLDDPLLRFYQVSSSQPQLNVTVDPEIISFLKEYITE
jgi:DNA-binding XRE family transcriptional regulator